MRDWCFAQQAAAGEKSVVRVRWSTWIRWDIDLVNTTVIRKLLDNGSMPVVGPLSADDKGVLLKINADTVAAAIAARRQLLVHGAPGILGDERPGSPIPYTDLPGLKRMREEAFDCRRHVAEAAKAIEDAIRGGVRRVHVVAPKLPRRNPRRGIHERGTGTLIAAGHQRSIRPPNRHSPWAAG